jgi:hypothetical protein
MDRMFTEQFSADLDRATSEVIKKTTQFKVTELTLEIKLKEGEGHADMPVAVDPDGKEYPDYVAHITLYEPKKGAKRASVSGDFPMEAWADIMKYLKSIL